jgi:hypothetical protein
MPGNQVVRHRDLSRYFFYRADVNFSQQINAGSDRLSNGIPQMAAMIEAATVGDHKRIIADCHHPLLNQVLSAIGSFPQ